MIIVSGTFQVDPARHEDAVAVGTKMAEASRAEAGCIAYGFWCDPHEPAIFRVFEEWASAEALDSHFAEPHMADFLAALPALGVANSEISRYEVTGKSKLM